MRITNGMIADSTMRNINKAANRLADANAAVSSNQKIQKASDDPVVAARAVTYRSYVSQIKQYQDNVDAADGWQTATDDALSELSDIITQLKTLATEASSTGTLSESDLSSIKSEVEELQTQVVTVMNSTYNGKYIFGGYSTTEEPYEIVATDIGDTATYKDEYLSLGGVISSEISDSDIQSFFSSASSSVYDSLDDAATKAYKAYSTAASAGSSNAASLYATYTTIAAAVTAYGGSTNLTDAIASAQETYDSAQAAADADPTDTALAAAATAAKDTLDTLTAASNSNDQDINYNIGFNSEVTVNIEGQDVTGEGTTDNIFNTIQKLLLALDGDTTYKTASMDSSGIVTVTEETLDISDIIDELSASLEKVTTAQATLGARMEKVENASDTLGDAYTAYSSYMSNNEDIDTAEAATELTSAEYAYEATLSVGAKVISKSLIDYIG